MGVFSFPGQPGFRTHGQHLEDTHTDQLNDSISEVPGPGTTRKSRSRKRLSPAAVIARSLAPDAQHMSPVDIIARSVEQAFGGLDMFTEAPAQPAPPPPAPPSDHPLRKPDRSPFGDGGLDPFEEFWQVWMEHQDYLFKQSIRFMSGNVADAEDALSQAMLKGSQHFNAETIRNQRAWLTRLVHNACMDQHRSHKRQARLSDEIDGDDPEQAPNITPQPPRAPDEALHMRQIFDELEQHLCDMPMSLLQPLLLRVVEEKSYDEIANAMGLSNCAVRKRIQLARDRLRQAKVI
ncbi:RNA polymerase sigma factor [Magnetovibrio sp. PR-2]|uniref:RNA polymerase sigma factor n=1 Tax=Magnetovibrio sp. PR-2 TaxID=3120356 RepID=UPI002FCE36F5